MRWEDLLLRHILHTNPTSTTLRWQKHAARKSTPTAVGATRCFLELASGRNAIIKYCSSPLGCSSFMYTPLVASEACCKKTVSPAILQISMGIDNRWAAKIQFIIGIYWAARSPLTLRMRMREVRTGLDGVSGFAVVWLAVGVGERESVVLLMWVRASVSAPAMAVVGLLGRECGEVVESRWVRDVSSVS